MKFVIVNAMLKFYVENNVWYQMDRNYGFDVILNRVNANMRLPIKVTLQNAREYLKKKLSWRLVFLIEF